MTRWSIVSRFLARIGKDEQGALARTLLGSYRAIPGMRALGSRAGSVLAVNLLLAIAGLLVLAPPASADLATVPDDTVEANGRVSAILRVGDRIYMGGNFTELKTPDGRTVARNHLVAIDANTGEIVPGWNPNPNGSVRAITLSSNGGRLYIGGDFTDVGGLVRNRSAAIDLGTGSVDRQWTAGANSTVWAIAVSGDNVYLGGNFTTVKGQPRMRLAKVDGGTGVLYQDWTPSADQISATYGSVRAMAFSENEGRLYVGGYFRSISGQQTGNLVALDPITGVVDGGFRPNENNGILCLTVSGNRVFVGTGDDLEGIEAFDAATGQRVWHLGYGAHTPAEGDVQAITVRDGKVYAGGHFDKLDDQTRWRLVAVDAATGIIDSQWTPNVAEGNLGVWAIDSYGQHLYAGGDFTRVSGRAQERFAQFTEGPAQPIRGLTGEYFNERDFTGSNMTRTDATVNYDWGNYSPPSIAPDTFSARWSGEVRPAYSEVYTFYTTSDDGVRLWVNGQPIIDNWTDHAPTENSGQIALNAGQQYDIRMEFYENGGGAAAKLSWSSARQGRQIVPQSRLYPAVSPPVDTSPPGAPVGLTATATQGGGVSLDWADNAEADLAGYSVYRSTTSGGPYTRITPSLLTSSAHTDAGAREGTTYRYVVAAADRSGNESAYGNEASAAVPVVALSFDGVDDRVSVPSSKLLNQAATGARTYEALIRTGPDVTKRQFVYEEGGDGNGLSVEIADGRVHFSAWSATNGWGTASASAPVSPDATYHVAGVYDRAGGDLKIYLDGALQGTSGGVVVGAMPTHGDGVAIGGVSGSSRDRTNARVNSGSHFGGKLGEFAAWNHARTGAQVQEDARGDLRGDEAGLIALYEAQEGGGTILNDSSPNNLDGTISGASWATIP